MAKPRLEKVEALFYVLKQVAKGGCIRILIHPLTFFCYFLFHQIVALFVEAVFPKIFSGLFYQYTAEA